MLLTAPSRLSRSSLARRMLGSTPTGLANNNDHLDAVGVIISCRFVGVVVVPVLILICSGLVDLVNVVEVHLFFYLGQWGAV